MSSKQVGPKIGVCVGRMYFGLCDLKRSMEKLGFQLGSGEHGILVELVLYLKNTCTLTKVENLYFLYTLGTAVAYVLMCM